MALQLILLEMKPCRFIGRRINLPSPYFPINHKIGRNTPAAMVAFNGIILGLSINLSMCKYAKNLS